MPLFFLFSVFCFLFSVCSLGSGGLDVDGWVEAERVDCKYIKWKRGGVAEARGRWTESVGTFFVWTHLAYAGNMVYRNK